MDNNINTELNYLLVKSIANDTVLPIQYKAMFRVNLIKKRCQHIVWHLLHSFSVFYPENPTDIQKENTKELLLKIKLYMPFCMKCSNNNADNFVENSDLNSVVKTPSNLINFLIEYHKYINQNFSKQINYDSSIYTNEFIKNKYENGSYEKYYENKYNISFLKIINNNGSLKHSMDNLQSIVIKEINNLNWDLTLNIVIHE